MRTASDKSYGQEFIDRIAKSDVRISKAIKVLSESARGQNVMRDLRKLLSGEASGLDSQGQKALLALVAEFSKNQRRNFLDAV